MDIIYQNTQEVCILIFNLLNKAEFIKSYLLAYNSSEVVNKNEKKIIVENFIESIKE